jgi:4a-hydroxytetrahydrobiopterin dehydratase
MEPCKTCATGPARLSDLEVANLMRERPGWRKQENRLERLFTFKDFRKAMQFVNAVADIAESQGHHPDIDIRYNEVRLALSTHSIGGLSKNDFALAAKIDTLLGE